MIAELCRAGWQMHSDGQFHSMSYPHVRSFQARKGNLGKAGKVLHLINVTSHQSQDKLISRQDPYDLKEIGICTSFCWIGSKHKHYTYSWTHFDMWKWSTWVKLSPLTTSVPLTAFNPVWRDSWLRLRQKGQPFLWKADCRWPALRSCNF